MELDAAGPGVGRRRKLQFSLRELLLLVLAVATYFAGWATGHRSVQETERQLALLREAVGDDLASAVSAKDAIVELMRTGQTRFCGYENADEMAQLPLQQWSDGQYYFGPFVINLRKLTYHAYLGFRDEPYDYRGTLSIDGGRCKASPPKMTRSRLKRGSGGSPVNQPTFEP